MEVIDTSKLSGNRSGSSVSFNSSNRAFSAHFDNTDNTSVPGSVGGGSGGSVGTKGSSVGLVAATARRSEPHNSVSAMLSVGRGGGNAAQAMNGDGDRVGEGGSVGGGGAAGKVRQSQQVAVVISAPQAVKTGSMKPPSTTPSPSPVMSAGAGKKSSLASQQPYDNRHHYPHNHHQRPDHHYRSALFPAARGIPPHTPRPALTGTTATVSHIKSSTTTPTPTTVSSSTNDSHHTRAADGSAMDNGNESIGSDDTTGDCDWDNDDSDDDDDKANNNTIGRQSTSSAGAASSSSASTTTTTTPSAVTAGPADTGGGGPIRNLRVRGQRTFLPEKTRHKRQTLQDMTRPLKQWLIRHKDNPYPSKAEKMDLVSRSHMTLTQVSNWFANARRRLKNTVKQPDLTWASRIKLYNSCVEGNAELFSICSDDSCPDSDHDMMEHRQSDTFHDDVTDSLTSSRTATPDMTSASGDTCSTLHHGSNIGIHSGNHNHHPGHSQHSTFHQTHSSNSNSSSSSVPSSGHSAQHHHNHHHNQHPYPGLEETCVTFPKYKHSILHRYLSDAHQQALILDEDSVAKSRDRHHSSSTGSRDFEELSTSSVSSPAHESLHHDHLDDFSEEFETMALRRRTSDVSSAGGGEEDMYWKEIGAALALTSLARGRVVNTT